MTFGEKIVSSRNALGLTQKELAARLGITATRLNYWEKDKRQPDVLMIQTIAEALGVSADYLIGNKKAPGSTPEAMKVAREYEALDEWGKRVVDDVIADERARMDAATEDEAQPMRSIPLLQPFAAGIAEPDTGNAPERYDVPADSPADFAIRVNGTSMEPYLRDHSIALGVTRAPRDGEVGAFVVNGEFLVKQMIHDHIGNMYLISLNREEADKDVTLWASEADSNRVWAIGTILTEKKVPYPKV